jgi:hypothetical protein
MGQESGEIWTAETRLQPILPKSDRLLDDGQKDKLPTSVEYAWGWHWMTRSMLVLLPALAFV